MGEPSCGIKIYALDQTQWRYRRSFELDKSGRFKVEGLPAGNAQVEFVSIEIPLGERADLKDVSFPGIFEEVALIDGETTNVVLTLSP